MLSCLLAFLLGYAYCRLLAILSIRHDPVFYVYQQRKFARRWSRHAD